MSKTDVLTLAILGSLQDAPKHGYQIRKQLGQELGAFRALSYGSLYPALKRMVSEGLISADADEAAAGIGSRRSKISYSLTADGESQLKDELASAGASAWEDGAFDVRFSMFSKTNRDTRLHILEGRRARLAERLEEVSANMKRVSERRDTYTSELHRHGLEQVEREVEWLDSLIETERSAVADNN